MSNRYLSENKSCLEPLEQQPKNTFNQPNIKAITDF